MHLFRGEYFSEVVESGRQPYVGVNIFVTISAD